ncbi:nicotinate-nucleotide adenylyltransferase [Fodinibius salinus]|uniref:Probable nicotinate-nucleotide adenylyltransferase n=1 Tax=Fodinibius salinus TaxID=860790 RepID=A0A5D3YM34_9BACT|nr:nicotinate (nicotinamide) nucleotide adenylyltransferase [Fodinibius salinus]TYP95215.1 nicotinate-nucleotide adenylyltransferase [Fodinibius salinus]
MSHSSDKIGLLGGSFDPVHNGHLAIARSFLASPYITELWVLLTPHPPHKRGQSPASYEVRLKMLQEAFAGFDRVEVSDIERQLPDPSYTVRTLEYLTDRFSEKSFFLCLGSDSAKHFTEWYQWQRILSYCELLVAARPSARDIQLNQEIAQKTHFIDHQSVSVSSTEVRSKASSAQNIADLVPASVEKIIDQQNLYKVG